jgi:hypothetical protein
VFLLKPKVVVGCHFESELGECLEVTSKWHVAPGKLRPGFRIMEVHPFLFEFVFPCRNKAVEHPAEAFKQTFACLDGCDLADEVKELKKKQMIRETNATRPAQCSWHELVRLEQGRWFDTMEAESFGSPHTGSCFHLFTARDTRGIKGTATSRSASRIHRNHPGFP